MILGVSHSFNRYLSRTPELMSRFSRRHGVRYNPFQMQEPERVCIVTIDRAMVEHIAELAKLQLTDQEIELYAGQLSAILEFAGRLQALDTDAIPPAASVLRCKCAAPRCDTAVTSA
jgi:aspartyl/glutamyl-tRNA(Asn/Gln) amidotransferase C subunit